MRLRTLADQQDHSYSVGVHTRARLACVLCTTQNIKRIFSSCWWKKKKRKKRSRTTAAPVFTSSNTPNLNGSPYIQLFALRFWRLAVIPNYRQRTEPNNSWGTLDMLGLLKQNVALAWIHLGGPMKIKGHCTLLGTPCLHQVRSPCAFRTAVFSPLHKFHKRFHGSESFDGKFCMPNSDCRSWN